MPKEILYVRVDHRVKVALSTLARQTVGEMSDHARVGIERRAGACLVIRKIAAREMVGVRVVRARVFANVVAVAGPRVEWVSLINKIGRLRPIFS